MPYTLQTLREMNTNLGIEHFLLPQDVEKVNMILRRMEGPHQAVPPLILSGDILICIHPEKGTRSSGGHIQFDETLGLSVVVHPSPDRFVYLAENSYYTHAGGGETRTISREQERRLVYKGKQIKQFVTRGYGDKHMDFMAEVHVWELTDPMFT